jgi:hypothetical protein
MFHLMTVSSPSRPGRLPGYDLEISTEDHACAMLQRVFGPDRGTTTGARS